MLEKAGVVDGLWFLPIPPPCASWKAVVEKWGPLVWEIAQELRGEGRIGVSLLSWSSLSFWNKTFGIQILPLHWRPSYCSLESIATTQSFKVLQGQPWFKDCPSTQRLQLLRNLSASHSHSLQTKRAKNHLLFTLLSSPLALMAHDLLAVAVNTFFYPLSKKGGWGSKEKSQCQTMQGFLTFQKKK